VIDSAKVEALLARVRQEVDEGLAPAVQVAVAHEGKVVVEATFSAAGDVGDDARFVGFSATKALVAAAIWRLIDAGEVAVDSPAAAYVPEFGTNGKDVVTVEHLLTHTGGFPWAPLGPNRWATREGRREAFSRWRLTLDPGSTFVYHPTAGHWVLGEILATVTGLDHADAIEELVTAPLGLPRLLGIDLDAQDGIVDAVGVGAPPTPEEMEEAFGFKVDIRTSSPWPRRAPARRPSRSPQRCRTWPSTRASPRGRRGSRPSTSSTSGPTRRSLRAAPRARVVGARDGALPADMHGIVTTYQQVATSAPALAPRRGTPSSIFDEIHHAGDDRAWGDVGAAPRSSRRPRRLSLSGTPFRSDTSAIPFVDYHLDEAGPDYEYGYGEALATAGSCGPCTSRASTAMEWVAPDGRVVESTFDDELPRELANQRLRTALSLEGEWLPTVLDQAHER
jgi:hypothetical protein